MKSENEFHDNDFKETRTQVDRRDFLVSSTLAALGTATFSKSFSAFAQDAKVPRGAPKKGPYPTEGMAAYDAKSPLKLMKFERRALKPTDVAIKIQYCGVCHSDIHTARGDWGKVQYPIITGHEIAGEVVAVGSSVSKFNEGDRVGVGTMVDSCGHCSQCNTGFQNYCTNGNTQTYGGKQEDGSITQGGYSTFIVVKENFVFDIPKSIDLAEAGPLLCAGITVYSPLRHWAVGPNHKVAINGMGGLGHLAVKIAKAMGAEVTVFTTSSDKEKDAKKFGAKDVVVKNKDTDYSKYNYSYDFILDTIPYQYDISKMIPLLKPHATLCRVGVGKVENPIGVKQMQLVLHRNAVAGSNTGGVPETQEFLNFCAVHKITPEIKKISMKDISSSWDKVVNKKARYRYVVDFTKG